MINLNGKNFAINNNEFINSLFTTGSTCTGFYKVNKTTITIQDQQRKKIGVINQHGVLCNATKKEELNGKYWYSLAKIDLIGEYTDFNKSINEPLAILNKALN